MSGSLLCGLPNVASQLPTVPRVTQSLPFMDLYSRQRSTCISLPPLPRYAEPEWSGKRWGEDVYVVEKTPDVASRERNNFDSCHPVPDVLSAKYEGYMFPKPLSEDISVLVYTPFNTHRHTPRDPVRELFPTNNSLRKAKDGKTHVLGQNTRQALSDYITRLYRTSRYDLNFKDTTDFMRRKSDRNEQFKEVMKDFCENPTCCNVLNHPYPCPYCWTAGANKGTSQYKPLTLYGEKADDPEVESKKTEKSCENSDVTSCDDRDSSKTGLTDDSENAKPGGEPCVEDCGKESGCLEETKEDSDTTNEMCKELVHPQTSDQLVKGTDGSSSQQAADKSESFGPWSGDAGPSDDCGPLLLSRVYDFKLPSSLHKAETENEYSATHLDRHGTQLNSGGKERNSLGPWTLRREKMSNSENTNAKASEKSGEDCIMNKVLEQQKQLQQQVMMSKLNSWTFRDKKNNLRIPCISKVIGYKNKTDVHTKIHIDHPEPTPDLRDFKRYSKRVNFYGYNSSVFR